MTLKRPRFRSQDYFIKYLEYEDIYNVGLKRGQIEKPRGGYMAFDWHYKL